MCNDSWTTIVQNGTTKAFSPTQSSLTLPPYEIRTEIMFTRKSKIEEIEHDAAVTRRSSGMYIIALTV